MTKHIRPLFLFLFLFLHQFATAQTLDVTLSPPVVVAGGSTYGSMRPRIALVNGNQPLVTWGKNAAPAYVARWNGSGFNTPVALTPAGLTVYAGSSEGPEVAGKGDTAYVVFFSLPTNLSKVYLVRSVDGGLTWSDTIRVSQQDSMPPYSPSVQVGRGGNPYIVYEAADNSMNDPNQYFTRSANGGNTFLPEVILSSSLIGQPCECCPPVMALRDTAIYVVYRNNASNVRECYVTASADHGLSFVTPTRIDYTNYNIGVCPSSGPDVILNGDSLTAVWMSKFGTTNRIYTGTWNVQTGQGGWNRFADPLPPVSGFPQARPALAGQNDTLGMVWDDSRNGNIDCWMSLSVTGVPGLQTRVQINDTASDAGTQNNCDVVYDGTKFHFVYTNSPTNEIIYRTLTINGFTGIETPPAVSAFTVFPNPATDFVTFTAKQGSAEKITITDATGKIIKKIATGASEKKILDVKDWAAGIYFYSNENGVTGKFTVIH